MDLPLEITFRNVNKTRSLEERIRAKAAKLDQRFERILGCRVVVEAPHRHQHKGNHYQIHIEISVPKEEIVISRTHYDRSHEDLGIVIRDAFTAAQRRLSAYARRHNAGTSHSSMRISEVLSA